MLTETSRLNMSHIALDALFLVKIKTGFTYKYLLLTAEAFKLDT